MGSFFSRSRLLGSRCFGSLVSAETGEKTFAFKQGGLNAAPAAAAGATILKPCGGGCGGEFAESVEHANARALQAGNRGERQGRGEVRSAATKRDADQFAVACGGQRLNGVGDVTLPVAATCQNKGTQALQLNDGSPRHWATFCLRLYHAPLIANFQVERWGTKQVRIESEGLPLTAKSRDDPAKRFMQRVEMDGNGGVTEGASGETQADLELGARLPLDTAYVSIARES